MKYLAFDAHIGSSDLSVRDARGNEIDRKWVPTEAHRLVDTVKSYPGKKTLVVEESNLAGWLKRTLEPHVTHLIVSNPRHNAWIAKDEEKDDAIDASKLSHLLYGGYIREVYHPAEAQQHFKNLVLHYNRIGRSVVRSKNQINAKFREDGIQCVTYSAENLDGLNPSKKLEIQDLQDLMEYTTSIRGRVKQRLVHESRKFPQIRRFQKVPGIGPIHSSTFYAIIDTPYRFQRKSKLWVFCGLGLKRRKSGNRVYRQGKNQDYNRYLKSMAKAAALIAVQQQKPNRFKSQHHRLVGQGNDPRRALVVVARSIVSTLWGMWKSGEEYREEVK
jgi:transposase